MIVNNWSDLRNLLEVRLPPGADLAILGRKALEIFEVGQKAGNPLSSDWSAYLARWEKNGWENPDEDSDRSKALLSEERAELEELRAAKARQSVTPEPPKSDAGG